MSVESSNLGNIEHRAVIKYFVKKGKTPKEIFEDMVSVLQESAPSYTMVKNGLAYFNKDDRAVKMILPGRPVTESIQWTKKGERPPKKFKVQKSASKLMATIFWDSEGVLLIDYLPKGTTMNGQYYANLLAQARSSRTEAWEVIARSAVLQDNASVHTARVSRQALKDTGFSEIDHPPYSPDLAPSDYFLFSNLKKELRGRRFVDDNQMKMAVESHFDCKERKIFGRFEGVIHQIDDSQRSGAAGGGGRRAAGGPRTAPAAALTRSYPLVTADLLHPVRVVYTFTNKFVISLTDAPTHNTYAAFLCWCSQRW
ncbi:Mariner Mos1 transposase [Eumeta japonica]|uniref:Mariner Mos1 transposase n=1 Tax=Eumeta variegata TaxID=151549 RepID=A0A4C1YZ02_EUMVA|nr:Mariner Mos1 transposase [Eumeta japonica]